MRILPLLSALCGCDVYIDIDPGHAIVSTGEASVHDESLPSTEIFSHQPGEIDVLFVIDDSGSMAEEQHRLRDAFPSLVADLDALGLDYHVGVITTDMRDPAKQGRLQPDAGDSLWISPGKGSAVSFSQRLPGVGGDSLEQGLSALSAALDTHAGDANAGFRRAGAQLAVLTFSDEDDASTIDPVALADALDALGAHPGDTTFSVAVEPPDGRCGGTPGRRYLDMFSGDLSGVELEICAPSYAPMLHDLVDDFFCAGMRYPLTLITDPSTITLTRGTPPALALSPEDWVYDDASNTVRLTASAEIAAGEALIVDYAPL